MTDTTTSKAPTHIAYHVRNAKAKGFFTRIGVAWLNKDGKGFNMQLDGLVPSTDGYRPPRHRKEDDRTQPGGASAPPSLERNRQ